MSEKKEVPSGVIEPAQKVAGMRVPAHVERPAHDEKLIQLVKNQVEEEDARSVSAKEEIAALVDKGKTAAQNERINPSHYQPPAKHVHDHAASGFTLNQPRK